MLYLRQGTGARCDLNRCGGFDWQPFLTPFVLTKGKRELNLPPDWVYILMDNLMRHWKHEKPCLFPSLFALVLVLCLTAAPFVHACGCAYALDIRAEKAGDILNPEASSFSDFCCHSGCGENLTAGNPVFDFEGFGNSDRAGSSDPSHPGCCCRTDTAQKNGKVSLVPTETQRSGSGELIIQNTGVSTILPDLHDAANTPLPGFLKNITPTSPHIASTVLLI